jgi:hypothetical protein
MLRPVRLLRARWLIKPRGSGTLRRMPVTYLDTVVYSEMDGRAEGRPDAQVTLAEEQALRSAMREGTVLVRPSFVVLDKLRLMRGLGNGFQGMSKPPATLLHEAIQAFADGSPPPDALLPDGERRGIVSYLSDVCAGSTRWDAVLTQVMGEIQGIKGTWRETMREAQEQALRRIDANPRMAQERQTLTFQAFFEAGAESLAGGFAEPLGCGEACRRRGLDGLLRVPAVRLCVGVARTPTRTGHPGRHHRERAS